MTNRVVPFIANGTKIAVNGIIVLRRARLALVSGPLVTTLTGAVGEEPSDVVGVIASVIVAVDGVGTDAVASREVDVSSGARVAVRFAIVLGGADGAGGSRPAVAAGTVTSGVGVANDVLRVSAAVGDVGASQIAERVRVIALGARATVVRGIEVRGAVATVCPVPHVAALAGAAREGVSSYHCGVTATVVIVRAGEVAMRICIVA